MSQREAAVFPDRARFMAYAARVMRGLIIDYARSRQAQQARRRSSRSRRSTADVRRPPGRRPELARIGDALDELAAVDPALAQVVDLKFFCGFSFAEIAGDARRLGADGAARLGEGAHLPPPQRSARRAA